MGGGAGLRVELAWFCAGAGWGAGCGGLRWAGEKSRFAETVHSRAYSCIGAAGRRRGWRMEDGGERRWVRSARFKLMARVGGFWRAMARVGARWRMRARARRGRVVGAHVVAP